MRIASLACVLSLAFAQTAIAQDQKEPSVDTNVSADMYVTQQMKLMVDKWLDEDHALILKSLAYQVAVASACDDFSIDKDRFKAESENVYPSEDEAKLPEDEQKTLNDATNLAFGTIYGAYLLMAARDFDGFCTHAEEERADPAAEHLVWVAKE